MIKTPLIPVGRLLEFIHPTAVIGHDITVKIIRVVASESRVIYDNDRYFIPRVLDSSKSFFPYWGYDPIAGEYQFRVVYIDLRLDPCGESGIAL